jgi:predicted transcriptional regulator YheO
LGQTFGKYCEIVVHDFNSPESSIISIENGSLTGRKIGDTLDALGFQLLKTHPASDLLNYRTKTKEGKELRSSSVFLRDEKGQIFGALCINIDVSGLLKAQEWLQEALGSASTTIDERFEHSVDEVLENLIQNAISSIDKKMADMTREDKVAIVAYLEAKGAFLIRYSVERVAELLGMTKYTIYNYLDEIRKKQEAAELEPSRTP